MFGASQGSDCNRCAALHTELSAVSLSPAGSQDTKLFAYIPSKGETTKQVCKGDVENTFTQTEDLARAVGRRTSVSRLTMPVSGDGRV